MAKNILITGPTSGIGYQAALALAKEGHRLFLLCRNPMAGKKLATELEAMKGAQKPTLLFADLAEFDQIKEAAESFLAMNVKLDVLINNAGIVNTEHTLIDGVEQMFKVNHLGHFLLVNLLLDKLKESQGRIVVVASDAHAFCQGIQFEDINFNENFSTFKTYGHSKLANMLMVHALAKKLAGTGVVVNSLHPGMVASNLGGQNKTWYTPLLMLVMKIIAISPRKGADTLVYLATTKDVTTSGGYYYKRKTRGSRRWARSDEDAERLWQLSEQLTQAWR